MATQPKIYAHITKRPGVCGGQAAIDETRVRVYNIVCLVKEGCSPEQTLEYYPQLTLGQVHAALAYYYDHREEIEAELEAQEHLEELVDEANALYRKKQAAR